MAQGDLFLNFLAEVKGLNTVPDNIQSAFDKLQAGQINVFKQRREMLKSETESFNILKRTKSVTDKIYSQMKNNYKVQKNLENTKKNINIIERDINIAAKKYAETNDINYKLLQDTLVTQRNSLRTQYEIGKVQHEQMKRSIPLLGKMGKSGEFFANSIVKTGTAFSFMFKVGGFILNNLIKMGKVLVNLILSPLKKAFKVFLEIQSTVGNLAADIGLSESQSKGLLTNFQSLTLSSMKFGGTMKDVAEMIKTFSATTNKNRIFNEKEVEQLTELGLGTGLGVQGATQLAASFDNINISLSKTIKLTDRARNIAAKYNVNTAKVLTTYNGLVTSLTGIGFGKGLANLTKLAAKAVAIRFDIQRSTEAFKDTFFEPEKAVEAAAKMQVLGGEFAKNFGDPIQLAFESMNEPQKLAERVTDLVRGSIVKSGNDFIIPPAERKMLRMAAETLGQDYGEMQNAAIEQAKMADKMELLGKKGINIINEEDRLAFSGLINMGEKGYEVKLSSGATKLLSEITTKGQLDKILDDRKKNEKAAMQRLNMMQRLQLIGDRFIMGVSQVFDKLFGGESDFESFLGMIEKTGTEIAQTFMNIIKNSGGITATVTDIIEKAKGVFLKIEEIFKGDGAFISKIGQTLKLLFIDLAVPIISKIITFVTPLFQAGIGKLLEVIGDVIPKALGGNKIKNAGINMQSKAIANSDALKSLYGKDGETKLMNNMSPDGKGSFAQGAGLYGKAALGAATIPKGVMKLGAGAMKGTLGKGAMKLGAGTLLKRIPILGALVSAGFAVQDLLEGDFVGAGLNLASGAANVGNIFLPGVGSILSAGIDAGNAAREMGAFDDGVIYKDGSYAKFAKGDMVQFIDQAAMERAGNSNNNNSMNSGVITHSGVITIKSDDGKVVTWEQMYGAKDLIGSHILSASQTNKSGFGNFSNSNTVPIKPLM